MAEVGTPATNMKASIFLSFSALADSAALRRSRVMSLSLSMPAASITRIAKISVPLPGAPVETRLPFRSSNLLMPLPSSVTTCMRFGYMTTRARTGSFLGNLSRPLSGIDGSVDLGEGDVGVAGADQLQVVERAAGHLGGRRDARNLLAEDGAEAAGERIVDAAGAAGGDGELLGLLGLGCRRADAVTASGNSQECSEPHSRKPP